MINRETEDRRQETVDGVEILFSEHRTKDMTRTIYIIGLFFFLAGLPSQLTAQAQRSSAGEPFSIWMEPNTDDFATIQQQAEAYFEGRDKGRGTGYKQWKRWEYLNSRRLTEDGKITNHAVRNWDAFMEYSAAQGNQGTRATNGSWYFLGPTNWTNSTTGWGYNPGVGRVNCIAFHPTDANILWVGLPSGGLWKTINHGGNWYSLTDGIPSIGVSGIVVHPTSPNVIYILTGDGDGADTYSIGVLKTFDGGTSWYETGLTWDISTEVRGYKLIMDPSNSSEIWAVTNIGLYRTTNSGSTWDLMLSGSFRDLEFKPGSPSTMYAATSSNFYRSTDGGANWTLITSGLPSGEQRIAIGVSPDNSAYVYLVCGPGGALGDSTFRGLYRSFDSGLSFTLRSTEPNILGGSNNGGGSGNQSWYDLAIAVSRTDVGTLICGGINTWRSVSYGVSWSIRSHWRTTSIPAGVDYVHADIHALEVNPLNNRLYAGSDGGIFWSTDFGTNWTDMTSGLGATQWYKIAGFEGNSSLIIGGTQDNGSNKYTGSYTITHMLGADGMDCAISHTNSNTLYSFMQNGALFRSTNGGDNYTEITPSGSSGSWVTPIVMDPNNSSVLIAGYSDVYRTTNSGSSWANLGSNGSAAVAISPASSTIFYAANGSTLQRTSTTGITWTTISGGLPSLPITGIAIDPQAANQVWVSFGNFSDGNKVFFTSDASASPVVWTNISGSLPNTPVNCIVTDDGTGTDNVLYIGTDIGVFYRDATLGDWIPFSNWLPTVPVFDLEINNTSSVITAGTYGRGLWRSSMYTDCVPTWTLGGTGHVGYSYYQASDYISSSRTFDVGVGQEAFYKAGNYILLTQGFKVQNGSKFKAFIGPCGAGIPSFDGTTFIGTFAGPLSEMDGGF